MNARQLAELNVGQNLDNLMTLDPRGYGVCRILYPAARALTDGPLSMNAARKLLDTVRPGDLVYILTGFVLLPHGKAEMDGICGAMLLARTVARGLNATPVLVVPEENLEAARCLAPVVGLHLYSDIAKARALPHSMACVSFTKETSKARVEAEALLAQGLPSAVVSTETPGMNALGVYHNAAGLDVTTLEAKLDVLFDLIKRKGILNIAVGDLGNELGMGAIYDHLLAYIPRAAKGECECGCGGGLAATTAADHIITATVSDWGVYAMVAALAYLKGEVELCPTSRLVRAIIETAARAGMVNMYGDLDPAVDGVDDEFIGFIVDVMRKCVEYPSKVAKYCNLWFDKTLEKGFFQ